MTGKNSIGFKITGPGLSFILHDCESSMSDQVGFLIGDKVSVASQSISDEDVDQQYIDTTYTISGSTPIGLPFLFSSPLGRIHENILREIIGSSEKEIIGWYSCRRNTPHRASLRETLMHKELSRIFKNVLPHLLFCLITSVNERCSTYSYSFTFSVFTNRRFLPVGISEINLGDPEDTDYRRSSENSNSYSHLQEVLQSVNGMDNSKMVMNTLNREINRHIEALQNSILRLQNELDISLHRIKSSTFTCTVVSQKCSRGDQRRQNTQPKRVEHCESLSAEY